MPARTAGATLSGLIDDISSDEFAHSEADALLTPDSAIENRAPARKAGRPKASSNNKPAAAAAKVTKARATTRRVSGASVAAAKSKASTAKQKVAAKRSALVEKQANASDTEEVDEFADEFDMKRKAGEEGGVGAKKPAKTTKRGRGKAKVEEEEEEEEEAPMPEPVKKGRGKDASTAATKKSSRTTKRAAEPEVVPETQADPEPEPMDIEASEQMEEVPETQPIVRAVQRSARQPALQPIASGRSRPAAGMHRRAGSASDTERGDPMLRRKLGEMTKKFENVDLKYKQLREIGMQDKETNFEKLKRATDKREQDQNNIITSLKRQLEEQKALANESKALQSEIQSLTAENKRLASEKRSLSTSLTETQSEVKSLSTKLAASRAQSAEPSKVPGSAVKKRPMLKSNSNDAAADTQIRQLKEDLYSDLTGLIIRGIKKVDGEDVYDCIQTGRNGTLHFHLTVASEEEAKAAGESYEDVEFAYTPHLDSNRDKDLLDILPDYLMEEICFPRNNAAKFYAKIVECITKKIVIED